MGEVTVTLSYDRYQELLKAEQKSKETPEEVKPYKIALQAIFTRDFRETNASAQAVFSVLHSKVDAAGVLLVTSTDATDRVSIEAKMKEVKERKVVT